MIGSYILVLFLEKDCKIKIGSLGLVKFKKGYYAYVGSAMGKTLNLEKRVERHKKTILGKTKNLRWHIDYFLASKKVKLFSDIKIKSNKKIECKISKKLEKISDGVVKGFGSSDCKNKCLGHLYYFKFNPIGLILKTLNLKNLT